ncbi:hypothetical protein [Nostoc sp. DSM 114167]
MPSHKIALLSRNARTDKRAIANDIEARAKKPETLYHSIAAVN